MKDSCDDTLVNLKKITAKSKISGINRESNNKVRKQGFKELMRFNLDNELAMAEHNLSVVTATQQFVKKALKRNNRKEQVTSVDAAPATNEVVLKTSIKQNNTKTTFKGINIMTMQDGKGLKFGDQNIRKVQFDV